MGLRTLLLVSLLLALMALLSGQPAFADFPRSPLVAPGTYQLLLRGQTKDLDGNRVTAPNKVMTLYISRDSESLTFRFVWTHSPGSEASADHFLFLAGFDLDHDGFWEDVDGIPYTIDDTLGFWYLGYTITGCGEWWCPEVVGGERIFSWDRTLDTPTFTEITVNPQYPDPPGGSVVLPSSFTAPLPMSGKKYSYTLSFTVPLDLFPASPPSGFGFGLIQETALKDGNHNLVWVWPGQKLPESPNPLTPLTDAAGAALLGDLIW